MCSAGVCQTLGFRCWREGKGREWARQTDKGTPLAAALGIGAKHEVVNDELVLAVKEVEESDWAVGALELVLLVDFDHGELAELSGEGVLGAGEGFLLLKEGFPGCQPFFSGRDL